MTCFYCGDRLVRSPAFPALWLSDREGPRRALCPDGQRLHAAQTEGNQ